MADGNVKYRLQFSWEDKDRLKAKPLRTPKWPPLTLINVKRLVFSRIDY